MVVQEDTCHVNWSVIRSGFVREEELVDLSAIHLRETGESCGIDEGNLQRATSGVRGDGVSEEIGARATVSGDIKESVCDGEQNVILPNP